MRRICMVLLTAVLMGVFLPAAATAGEHEGFLFLMQVNPLAELAHNPNIQAAEEPPMVDMNHISVMHLSHAVLAAIILIFLAWLGARRIRNRKEGEGVIPDEGVTFKNIWELSVEALYNLVVDSLGEENGKKFLPFLGTLFIYIFVCNIMGLVPGLMPPTTSFNVNLGMAICVFVYYNISGIREHGFGYFKHFLGPILALGWLIAPIELISHCVRMLSLSVRLFGNMTGDHTVLFIFTNLTKLVVPVVFLCLGLFVSFIQALVFTLLSIIYFQLALAHEH